MGLFSPIMVTGKTLLQDLWVIEFNWDDPVEYRRSNCKTSLELQDILKYKAQRYIGTEEKDWNVYNIVCFCDASKKAYATVVYLHQESDRGSEANLVFLKITCSCQGNNNSNDGAYGYFKWCTMYSVCERAAEAAYYQHVFVESFTCRSYLDKQ